MRFRTMAIVLCAVAAPAASAQVSKAAFDAQVAALTPHLGTGDTVGAGAIFARIDELTSAHVAALTASLKSAQSRYEDHRATAGSNFAKAHAEPTPARDSAVKDEQARLLKEYEGVKAVKDRLAKAQGAVARLCSIRTNPRGAKDEILAKLSQFAGTL